MQISQTLYLLIKCNQTVDIWVPPPVFEHWRCVLCRRGATVGSARHTAEENELRQTHCRSNSSDLWTQKETWRWTSHCSQVSLHFFTFIDLIQQTQWSYYCFSSNEPTDVLSHNTQLFMLLESVFPALSIPYQTNNVFLNIWSNRILTTYSIYWSNIFFSTLN